MNLLIVDDEYYTVESISLKVQKLCPSFDQILKAYNLEQALEIFSAHTIDLMICDIEMPGGSGLELLDKIRQSGFDTVCIFLTAYAKFEYISRAMKLSSSDYLLKPIDDQNLVEALQKGMELRKKQEDDRLNTLHAHYWKESELPLAEQFFLDLLSDSISSAPSELSRELYLRRLDETLILKSYFPLLIQLGQGNSFSPLDNRSLYEFALKNIVREYFFLPEELPLTIRIATGFYLLLLPSVGRTQNQLVGRCRQAQTDFVPHFPFSVNFYVFADSCLPEQLRPALLRMQNYAKKNVSKENYVFDFSLGTSPVSETHRIPSERWSDLLLSGRTDQLFIEFQAYLNQMKNSDSVNRDSLTDFYYQLLQLFFRHMQSDSPEAAACRASITVSSPEQTFVSFSALKDWISKSLTTFTAFQEQNTSRDNAVETVKKYIETHLDEELDRDSLASMVYLNADYLSHLFKKDTGTSLINYIIDRRIARSKELLAKGEMSIRDIALTCGFQNISYFSRQFKKSTGMTPREFRK